MTGWVLWVTRKEQVGMPLDIFVQGEVGGLQDPLLWPVLTVPCKPGHSSCLFLAAPNQTPHVTDCRRGALALCCPHVAALCLSPRVTSEGMVCWCFPLCVSGWACAKAFAASGWEPCWHGAKGSGQPSDPGLTTFSPAATVCCGT